jgi:hypothetical protein
MINTSNAPAARARRAEPHHPDHRNRDHRHQRQRQYRTDQTEHEPEPEQTVPLARELVPRHFDLRLVQCHAMQEHELPPAVEPQEQHAQRLHHHHQHHRQRYDPSQITHDEILPALELVLEISSAMLAII